MMRVEYEQTLETYKKLGQRYLDAITNVEHSEMDTFVRFFAARDRILDAGCAGGRDSALLSMVNLDVTGIDVVPEFIKKARKWVPEATFSEMDLFDLRFPLNHFDGIWAPAVLLHVKKNDLLWVLGNLHMVLKPGGTIMIKVKEGEGEGFVTEKLSGGGQRYFSWYSMDEICGHVGQKFRVFDTNYEPDDLGRDFNWITVWAEKR